MNKPKLAFMTKRFTRFLTAAGAACLLFAGNQAWATHAAGSDLTYINIAPNMYLVQYKLFRDCSGITMGNTETITFRAPGCNATAQTSTVTLGGKTVGNPYCTGVTAGCSPTGPTNYEEHTYSGTITLPTLCPNWIVSARIGNRINSRNLNNGGGEWLFSEAIINNVAAQNNNSPVFGQLPIPFVGVDRTVTINHSVLEPDGDSLAYSLKPALSDLNTQVVYSTYPAGTSPAGTTYPGGTFSATNPIISQNPVLIDPLSGNITLRPLSYTGPSVPSSNGADKYVMVVQVDEYRKINGVTTKIGHVRRDMLVTVIDCGPNQLPTAPGFRIGTTTIPNGGTMPVAAGQQVIISIDVTDANPNQIVTLTSNVTAALPGATVVFTNSAQPTATISWTPTAAQIRQAPYWFTVTATDDACPVKGFQVFSLGLRVGTITGISENLPANSFVAYPNPANNQQVTFTVANSIADKNATVTIYNVAGKVVDTLDLNAGATKLTWTKNAELPAGIYFARLTTAKGTQTIKLIHQH